MRTSYLAILRYLYIVALLGNICLFAGCLARQVASDGNGLRQIMVEMYTEQAFDNLVRAYNNDVFAQFAYTNLSVLDVDRSKLSALTGGGDFTRNTARDVTKAAALQVTRTVTNAWKFPLGLNDQRDRTLSFEANPVTNQNSTYEAYQTFARDPNLFQVSCQKPNCPVHIMRKCGNCWYWVPCEAGPQFLQLVISTAFVSTPNQPLFWTTTIVDVPTKTNEEGQFQITLGKEVPNDNGWLFLKLRDSRRLTLKAFAQLEKRDAVRIVGPGSGAPTKLLYAQIPVGTTIDHLEDLKNAQVQFVSDNYPNTAPPPGADLQKLQDAIDNIRLIVKPTSTN